MHALIHSLEEKELQRNVQTMKFKISEAFTVDKRYEYDSKL